MTLPPIHKAEPAPQFAQDASSVCIHCHRDIKRVPGGQGSTWVHADSGAVVGRGEPVDTGAMMAIREEMRLRLTMGADLEKVMYDAARQTGLGRAISEEQLRKIVADLREEGLIPPLEVS